MSAALRPMPELFNSSEIARYYSVRVPGIIQKGREWRGPCPIHKGIRDSFAVNSETGDWFCHSDCGRGGSLISFEMELTGRAYSEAAAEVKNIVGRPDRQKKGPIVNVYDYPDENGQLSFQCVRHEPKDFSQRRPDGHDSPRQCVFAGSVSHTTYLRDETGGRRFWPVACGQINIEALARDRDQLWAEAYERYKSGSPWWLDSRELNEQAEDEQSDRCEEDPWQELVVAWVENRDDASIAEILAQCPDKPKANWSQSDRTRVARCLRALHWRRKKVGRRGEREWRYKRQ